MNKILTIIFVMLFSCAVCVGQETETAAKLNLTGTSLPANAQRVLRKHIPVEIHQTLDKLVSASNAKLRRGDTEVLLWTGDELNKTGATTIVNRLTNNLKAAGWIYEVGGAENGVTIFSLLKDGANPRAIFGFYGEADGILIFAVTELHASGGEQTNSNPTSSNKGGNVSDYSFTTPPGWSRTDFTNKIMLSNDGKYVVEFFPLMNSSGNLERDAERILWQLFKGYGPWFGLGFKADYGTFEKGRTVQGLEYYRVYRYAKKVSDVNDQSRVDVIILLVKLGDKVAVITGSQPFQGSDYSGTALHAINFILYDLAFKGVTDSYDLKNELLGSWSSVGSVALAYTFNANGTYHFGGASQLRTSRDEYTDNVTTTSLGTTSRYSLSGNILTEKGASGVHKSKIRIYYTKYDKDPWQHKLGKLPLDSKDGGTVVLQRNK
jgi:hypothetical protein